MMVLYWGVKLLIVNLKILSTIFEISFIMTFVIVCHFGGFLQCLFAILKVRLSEDRIWVLYLFTLLFPR